MIKWLIGLMLTLLLAGTITVGSIVVADDDDDDDEASAGVVLDDDDDDDDSDSLSLGTLVVSTDGECETEDFGDRCIEFTVACSGIADATGTLRVTGTGAEGTVVLTTGGKGTGLFRNTGGSPEGQEVVHGFVDTLLADGFRLVELAWDEFGIWEGPGGSRSLACRSATALDWVHQNIHGDGLFAAQGNSGGSAQIAFSLAYYGLNVLDLANLSSGPPPCPISTDGQINFEEQELCVVGGELFDESREPMLFGDPRFHYPDTAVRFFLGENEPSAYIIDTANDYHDGITSEKSLEIVPNTAHGVHQTEEGSAAMIDSIREAAESD